MEITFFNSISDPRTVTKDLTQIAIAQCEPFGTMDINNPIIRVKPFTYFASVNYFYIADYLRYYSVQKIVRISGDILEIYGTVDVLMTYDNAIRQCRGVCISNENIGAGFVVDNNYPLDVRKKTEIYEFEADPFNTETATDATFNFVLNVAGGTYIAPEPDPEPET